MARDARLLGLLVAVVALGALSPLAASGADDEAGDPAVTRDAIRLPAGCGPREVAGLFGDFFAALETGDEMQLRRVFAEDDPPGKAIEPGGRAFRWYSVTEGGGAGPEAGGNRKPLRHFVTYDVADLLPYLAERRRKGERMQLVAVEVGRSWITGAAGGAFAVRREADDLEPGLGGTERIAIGKFELDCVERRFFVWSMGMTLAPGQSLARSWSPCPKPPAWAPADPVVACTRGPNARALAPDFRLGSTRVALPTRCRPAAVRRRVVTALAAFNTGLGDDFARQFVSRGRFHPYAAEIGGAGLVGGKAMRRFVGKRYRAGDGWTATELITPTGPVGLPKEAVYLLRLRVTYQGALLSEASGAKLVLNCANGKLRAWSGPDLRLPPE